MTPREFVSKYISSAIQSEKDTGVPALVTLAQAAVESGWGERAPGNNFFGIKADPSWKGSIQVLQTREVINGQNVIVSAKFRKYSTPEESFRDHGFFLIKNKNYSPAFLTSTPEDFAIAVANGGYATDPSYGKTLVKVIGLIRPMAGEHEQRPSPPPLDANAVARPSLFTIILNFLRSIFGGR